MRGHRGGRSPGVSEEDGLDGLGRRIVDNAQALARGLLQRGFKLITGGTDNHLLLMDLRAENLTGAEAAERLEQAGIVANKNGIPFDPQGPRLCPRAAWESPKWNKSRAL